MNALIMSIDNNSLIRLESPGAQLPGFLFVHIKLQSDLSRSVLHTLRLRPELRFWISGKP